LAQKKSIQRCLPPRENFDTFYREKNEIVRPSAQSNMKWIMQGAG
jgi:hypothetical protein